VQSADSRFIARAGSISGESASVQTRPRAT
jgi:hypothetical protein